MVKDYRKKVGSKTGGIKLHAELKTNFIEANIKIGRDKFYRFLRLNNLLIPKNKITSQRQTQTICTKNIRTLLKTTFLLDRNNYGLAI